MNDSDTFFDQGKLRESLVYARRAASLYVPGLVHVRRADARLDAIAAGAESNRMQQIALFSWQAIRATELLRPVGVGRNAQRLSLANRRMTGILVTMGNGGALATEEHNSAVILAELEATPHSLRWPWWGQVLALGVIVVGFVGMAFGIARRGLGSVAVYSSAFAVIVGAIGWAVCLLFA
jgi:hypothetical protein